MGRRGAAQYASQQGWQVTQRQLDTYSSRARALLGAQAERDRAVELGKALEQLDLLFMKAMAASDRPEARAVLGDRIALLGLAAAGRHEFSGPGGEPLQGAVGEAAAEFVAEFKRKASTAALRSKDGE